MLAALDMAMKEVNGEEIPEEDFDKLRLHSREELLEIYQAFKKAVLLIENIIV